LSASPPFVLEHFALAKMMVNFSTTYHHTPSCKYLYTMDNMVVVVVAVKKVGELMGLEMTLK
jgi:hypothetical protein